MSKYGVKKNIAIIVSAIAVTLLIGVASSAFLNYIQVASASTTTSTTTTSPSSANPIQLSAKEENQTYRWADAKAGTINPPLTVKAGATNTIDVKNPTDTEHNLIIESNGKEVASSGDIKPASSGSAKFSPQTGATYSYHCEYHPTTMKGTIQVG
jgi:plastocyanin